MSSSIMTDLFIGYSVGPTGATLDQGVTGGLGVALTNALVYSAPSSTGFTTGTTFASPFSYLGNTFSSMEPISSTSDYNVLDQDMVVQILPSGNANTVNDSFVWNVGLTATNYTLPSQYGTTPTPKFTLETGTDIKYTQNITFTPLHPDIGYTGGLTGDVVTLSCKGSGTMDNYIHLLNEGITFTLGASGSILNPTEGTGATAGGFAIGIPRVDGAYSYFNIGTTGATFGSYNSTYASSFLYQGITLGETGVSAGTYTMALPIQKLGYTFVAINAGTPAQGGLNYDDGSTITTDVDLMSLKTTLGLTGDYNDYGAFDFAINVDNLGGLTLTTAGDVGTGATFNTYFTTYPSFGSTMNGKVFLQKVDLGYTMSAPDSFIKFVNNPTYGITMMYDLGTNLNSFTGANHIHQSDYNGSNYSGYTSGFTYDISKGEKLAINYPIQIGFTGLSSADRFAFIGSGATYDVNIYYPRDTIPPTPAGLTYLSEVQCIGDISYDISPLQYNTSILSGTGIVLGASGTDEVIFSNVPSGTGLYIHDLSTVKSYSTIINGWSDSFNYGPVSFSVPSGFTGTSAPRLVMQAKSAEELTNSIVTGFTGNMEIGITGGFAFDTSSLLIKEPDTGNGAYILQQNDIYKGYGSTFSYDIDYTLSYPQRLASGITSTISLDSKVYVSKNGGSPQIDGNGAFGITMIGVNFTLENDKLVGSPLLTINTGLTPTSSEEYHKERSSRQLSFNPMIRQFQDLKVSTTIYQANVDYKLADNSFVGNNSVPNFITFGGKRLPAGYTFGHQIGEGPTMTFNAQEMLYNTGTNGLTFSALKLDNQGNYFTFNYGFVGTDETDFTSNGSASISSRVSISGIGTSTPVYGKYKLSDSTRVDFFYGAPTGTTPAGDNQGEIVDTNLGFSYIPILYNQLSVATDGEVQFLEEAPARVKYIDGETTIAEYLYQDTTILDTVNVIVGSTTRRVFNGRFGDNVEQRTFDAFGGSIYDKNTVFAKVIGTDKYRAVDMGSIDGFTVGTTFTTDHPNYGDVVVKNDQDTQIKFTVNGKTLKGENVILAGTRTSKKIVRAIKHSVATGETDTDYTGVIYVDNDLKKWHIELQYATNGLPADVGAPINTTTGITSLVENKIMTVDINTITNATINNELIPCYGSTGTPKSFTPNKLYRANCAFQNGRLTSVINVGPQFGLKQIKTVVGIQATDKIRLTVNQDTFKFMKVGVRADSTQELPANYKTFNMFEEIGGVGNSQIFVEIPLDTGVAFITSINNTESRSISPAGWYKSSIVNVTASNGYIDKYYTLLPETTYDLTSFNGITSGSIGNIALSGLTYTVSYADNGSAGPLGTTFVDIAGIGKLKMSSPAIRAIYSNNYVVRAKTSKGKDIIDKLVFVKVNSKSKVSSGVYISAGTLTKDNFTGLSTLDLTRQKCYISRAHISDANGDYDKSFQTIPSDGITIPVTDKYIGFTMTYTRGFQTEVILVNRPKAYFYTKFDSFNYKNTDVLLADGTPVTVKFASSSQQSPHTLGTFKSVYSIPPATYIHTIVGLAPSTFSFSINNNKLDGTVVSSTVREVPMQIATGVSVGSLVSGSIGQISSNLLDYLKKIKFTSQYSDNNVWSFTFGQTANIDLKKNGTIIRSLRLEELVKGAVIPFYTDNSDTAVLTLINGIKNYDRAETFTVVVNPISVKIEYKGYTGSGSPLSVTNVKEFVPLIYSSNNAHTATLWNSSWTVTYKYNIWNLQSPLVTVATIGNTKFNMTGHYLYSGSNTTYFTNEDLNAYSSAGDTTYTNNLLYKTTDTVKDFYIDTHGAHFYFTQDDKKAQVAEGTPVDSKTGKVYLKFERQYTSLPSITHKFRGFFGNAFTFTLYTTSSYDANMYIPSRIYFGNMYSLDNCLIRTSVSSVGTRSNNFDTTSGNATYSIIKTDGTTIIVTPVAGNYTIVKPDGTIGYELASHYDINGTSLLDYLKMRFPLNLKFKLNEGTEITKKFFTNKLVSDFKYLMIKSRKRNPSQDLPAGPFTDQSGNVISEINYKGVETIYDPMFSTKFVQNGIITLPVPVPTP